MEVGSTMWIVMGFCIAFANTWFMQDNIKQYKENPSIANKIYIAFTALTGPGLAVFLIIKYIL